MTFHIAMGKCFQPSKKGKGGDNSGGPNTTGGVPREATDQGEGLHGNITNTGDLTIFGESGIVMGELDVLESESKQDGRNSMEGMGDIKLREGIDL